MDERRRGDKCPDSEEHLSHNTAKKPKVLRPEQCRSYVQRRMAEALPDIVDHFLSKAKEGSIPHAKALASMGALDQKRAPKGLTSAKTRERHQQSLTEMLMRELKRGREGCGETPVEK